MVSPLSAIFKKFDLRTHTREEVVEEVRRLEATHTVQVSTDNDEVLSLSAIPRAIMLPIQQFHPDSLPGMVQLAKNVETAVVQTNRESKMSITDAPKLGEAFRNLLSEVKTALANATADMNGAMTELKDTTSQAVGMVKQVKAETADLKAALGLSSNNPPA